MHRITRRGFVAGSVALAAYSIGRRAFAFSAPAQQPAALPSAIRVHLFSGLEISRVDVASSSLLTVAIGSASRQLPALTFDRTGALTGELTNLNVGDAPVVIQAQGPLEVSASGPTTSHAPRHYNGTIMLQRSGASVLAVNAVDLDSYVASTLASEISPSWPVESLKAQAIVTRTYGVRAAAHSAARPYDVTDDTSNQVYQGLDGVVPTFVSAASATSGMTLQVGGGPADVFYSAACGGHTADSVELTGRDGPPYLRGIADSDGGGRPYCTPAPFFAWENTLKTDDLSRVVGDFADIQVKDRWLDGRAKVVRIVRTSGAPSYDMDARQFYSQMASVLGYKVLPSTMFDVIVSVNGFVFKGHGLGHGVGMCQWGARGRANAGLQAAQIVEAYFPGTVLSNPSLR
ncbi:MAG TPA: SpoIID/LytB domain-containing protein [Candidatus Binatus sp.]|nr:SpoIID/LytB domain-containing protein [Candidatus Binatus sp.]